jgi:long-chain acyl-CoA synthetase
MSEIATYLRGKTLLITGTTGFLAKGAIEKILRYAPDVKRLYLLIRTKRQKDGTTLNAAERLDNEILNSSAFARLRAMHGDQFTEVMHEKIHAVTGDLTLDHLGFEPDLYDRLAREVQIVMTCAASVTFDEEIDAALQLNTLGPRRILEFAKACEDAILIHVSTAYVSGQRKGRALEVPPTPDRSMAQEIGRSQTLFDVEHEIEDIMTTASGIHDASRSAEQQAQFKKMALRQNRKPTQRWLDAQIETFRKRWLKEQLIEEGMRRGQQWGWHDSYTMTKAMGEQLIVKYRGDLPTAIVRPSIVESSLVDPEPGWVEGLKVADPLIDAISRGRLPDFPGDKNVTLDIVPVDIVVNTILAAMPRVAQEKGISVYHVSTGDKNPIKFHQMFDLVYEYFLKNPRLNKHNEPIPVKTWSYPTLEQFRRRYTIRYIWPMNTALWCMDRLSWIPALNRWRQKVTVLKSAITRMLYYATIYSPYTSMDCTFGTDRTQQLHESLDPEDQLLFNCDVSRIHWPEYIQDIHIPGLKRHVLKTDTSDREKSEEEEVADRSGFDQKEEDGLPHLDTLTDILEKSAEMYGDQVALQTKRDNRWVRYTYKEVHDLAGHIGWHWRQNGLHPGDRVLLYSENSPEWGIACFATMAAGAAIVPIDRQTPIREIWSVARFTSARAILCSESGYRMLMDGAGNLDATEPVPDIPLWNIDNYGLAFDEDRLAASPTDKDPPAWAPVEPETVASIIFTKGTAVDPRGAVLTHRNFVSDLLSLAEMLRAYKTDQFLSILPLNHALEFTGGFLMPFYAGATITYTDTLKSRNLIELMAETETTCILSVPRIFKLLYERLRRTTEEPGNKVVERIRLLVSGGAALDKVVYDAYLQIGLTIYEGYGLTETAPILTVNPMDQSKPASVGLPLPNIALRIDNPDERGQGEIVVRGENVMSGYYHNPVATAEYLRDGWLYTGDIGYQDEAGYVYITGRSKDLIVTGAGKNVYPDEVEWYYQSLSHTKEFRIVGIRPIDSMSEDVHAVVVPDWPTNTGEIEDVRQALISSVQTISKSLPSYQRIQQVHIWDAPLPANGKPKERRAEFRRLLMAQVHEPSAGVFSDEQAPETLPWDQVVYRVIARLTQQPVSEISNQPDRPVEDLMDSLMRVELLAALETRFNATIPDADALKIHTVQDVLETVRQYISDIETPVLDQPVDTSDYWARMLELEKAAPRPEAVSHKKSILQRIIWAAGRLVYKHYFHLSCQGLEHIPTDTPFLIAANHSSHLDSGAIIVALWGQVDRVHPLGAKDYFFNSSLKAWFFGSIMNVVPFDRHDQIFESLRASSEVLSPDTPLLIYPEGTRSVTGELQPFKVGIGLLALELGVPIVPAYIRGTYNALPKGRNLPRRHPIEVVFDTPIDMAAYQDRKGRETNYDLYREITQQARLTIEQIRDSHVG